MKVKDVALSAASIIQADDIESALTAEEYDDPDVKTLIKCVNLAVAEASSDLPVIKTAYVTAVNGVIAYDALSADISTVRGVSRSGRAARFSLGDVGIGVEDDGRYEVSYTVAPPDKNADDDIELALGVGLDVVSYLAARNYCLVTGRTDEAAVWDQRYNAEAEKRRVLRRAYIPSRRWLM